MYILQTDMPCNSVSTNVPCTFYKQICPVIVFLRTFHVPFFHSYCTQVDNNWLKLIIQTKKTCGRLWLKQKKPLEIIIIYNKDTFTETKKPCLIRPIFHQNNFATFAIINQNNVVSVSFLQGRILYKQYHNYTTKINKQYSICSFY